MDQSAAIVVGAGAKGTRRGICIQHSGTGHRVRSSNNISATALSRGRLTNGEYYASADSGHLK
jgi:hypothetical protein